MASCAPEPSADQGAGVGEDAAGAGQGVAVGDQASSVADHDVLAAEQGVSAVDDSTAPYMCPICDVHDPLVFHEDGTCPVCGMRLIERPDSSQIGVAHIHTGSGNFLLQGGAGHTDELITVFYHQPERFTPESPILIVVPGAGRNANDYRDAWIEASETYGVLVLSPMYTEGDYDFGAYHLGGLLSELNLDVSTGRGEGPNEVTLDEERFTYQVNADPESWIFGDFDRLFETVAAAVGSTRDSYDLFGHSAGGQILHRLVLLHPGSRADRVLAGNSGFYTLPDPATPLPFGLEDAALEEVDLEAAFGQRLVLFLGEEDNASETGGTLLRSPTVDRQGTHRLERGRYFYDFGRQAAERLGVPFRWSLEVVPGVGHDHRGMSRAAAEYLYGG
jgi:pimeloyl-ACP methyl ester carboxylesterase